MPRRPSFKNTVSQRLTTVARSETSAAGTTAGAEEGGAPVRGTLAAELEALERRLIRQYERDMRTMLKDATRNPDAAVALAGRYAVAGIVERFTTGPHSLFAESEIHTFVGGGDADDIVELLPRPCTKLSDLVLRGLAVMAAGRES